MIGKKKLLFALYLFFFICFVSAVVRTSFITRVQKKNETRNPYMSLPAYKIVNLLNVIPKSKKYKYLTAEAARIDMHRITKPLSDVGLHFAKELGQKGGPYMRTHSIKNRLNSYVNKLSRDKTYIEVLPTEVDELRHKLPTLMTHDDLQLVEVGLNRQQEICKMAYTTTLSSSGRVVFLCIGMDGGLKTFYVTPTFKYRDMYTYSDRTMTTNIEGKMEQKKM